MSVCNNETRFSDRLSMFIALCLYLSLPLLFKVLTTKTILAVGVTHTKPTLL